MVTELGTEFNDLPQLEKMNEKGPFTDIDKFFTAVKNAQPGDLITLANNEYDVSNVPTFKERKGTAENPIYVRAQEPGKVILKGSSGYKFEDCTFFTWYGFNHRHKATSKDDNIVFEGGNNNRFARCDVKLDDIIKIEGKNIRPSELEEKYSGEEMCGGKDKKCPNNRHWLSISNCKFMKVDHCKFHHKETTGNFCIVGFDKDNNAGEGPIFEYNHFQHQDLDKHLKEAEGDAGGEAVRMGDSGIKRNYIRAIFRYNYLEECNGDGEVVTNKSSGNLYYNNTFTDCNGSLTLRHGDSTAVLANYFKNGGLRVLGANNLIANNCFTENSRKGNRLPLIIHNGDEGDDPSYEPVVNNNIILNTFANGSGRADKIVVWGSGNRPNKPKDNKFRGNIITCENGELFELGNNDPSNKIKDNIGWAPGNADNGGLSDDMATLDEDPLLTRDSDGIYRLQSDKSPACGLIQGTPFADLTKIDIDGEERGPKTDAGCDQFSTESKKPKKRITSEDVGPNAKTDLGDSPAWIPQS